MMQDEIRKRSGSVTIDCKLTSFLYTLMRDYVQPGDVEEIMLNHMSDEPVEYTNGWLALHAQDIANRLKSAKHYKLIKEYNLIDADWHLESDERQL